MASAYSQPIQYKGYEQQWNVDLMAKALEFKQNKYDVNRERINQLSGKINSIPLTADADKKYLQQRINSLYGEVQKYGMGDLSQAGVADNIMAHIGQAVDEKVYNAYEGTIVGQNISAQAKKAQESGKGYSDINLQYSLKEWNNWASRTNPDEAGVKYRGNRNYIPYTDKAAKAMQIMKENKPDIQVVKDSKGVQHFIYKKETRDDKTVEALLEGLLFSDPEVMQQMEVDAWAQFRGIDNSQISSALKGNIQKQLEEYGGYIKDLDNEITKEKDTQKKAQLITAKEQAVELQKSLGEAVQGWDEKFNSNPDYYKKLAYKDSFVKSMKEIYVKDNIIDITSITDYAALESMRNKYALQQIEAKNKGEKITEAQKYLMAIAKENGDLKGAGKILDVLGISPTGGYESWEDIANAADISLTEYSANLMLELEGVEGAEYFKEYSKNKENILTQKIQTYSALGLPITTETSDAIAMYNQKIIELKNKGEVGDIMKYEKVIENLNNLRTQEQILKMQSQYAAEQGILDFQSNGEVELGDGRKVVKIGEEYYSQDRAVLGEKGGNWLSGAWDLVKSSFTGLSSVASMPNISPRKGEKGKVITETLINIDDKIAQIGTILKREDIDNNTKDLIIPLYKQLEKHKGKNINELSYAEANKLYNEIDNTDKVLKAQTTWNKGIEKLTTSTRENKGQLTPISEKEAINMVASAIMNPKTKKELELASSAYQSISKGKTVVPSRVQPINDKIAQTYKSDFVLALQEYPFEKLSDLQIIYHTDNTIQLSGVIETDSKEYKRVTSDKINKDNFSPNMKRNHEAFMTPILKEAKVGAIKDELQYTPTNHSAIGELKIGDSTLGIALKYDKTSGEVKANIDTEEFLKTLLKRGVSEEEIVSIYTNAVYSALNGANVEYYADGVKPTDVSKQFPSQPIADVSILVDQVLKFQIVVEEMLRQYKTNETRGLFSKSYY